MERSEQESELEACSPVREIDKWCLACGGGFRGEVDSSFVCPSCREAAVQRAA